MIDEHGAELAADLLREFRLDLRLLFVVDSGVDPYWVLLLAQQLPHHSNFMCSWRGNPDAAGWDFGAYLSAEMINELRVLQYITQAVNTDSKGLAKISKPTPVKLPGTDDKKADSGGNNDFSKTAAQLIAQARGG